MAPEDHSVAEITKSHNQSWPCDQAEDDTECGFQERKDSATPLTSSFKVLGVGFGEWPWKQVGLPFLILFSNYMKCGEKGYWKQRPSCAE